MKKDFITPAVALTLVCLVMSAALAFGNSITKPVIEQAAAERAQSARLEIIPEADGFEPLELDSLPRSVTEVYAATNNAGYIFMVTTPGYGGEIKLICGVDPNGRIIRSKVLSHTETQGLGTIVFDRSAEYEGLDKNLEGINAIAGSTITSSAYKSGIEDALAAFDIIKITEITEEGES